jgi:hypothetical protein
LTSLAKECKDGVVQLELDSPAQKCHSELQSEHNFALCLWAAEFVPIMLFAVKAALLILTLVAMIAALALTPYGRARWEFYQLTGHVTPQRILETLQTPVRIGGVTEKGFLTMDGKLLLPPGITNLVISDSVKRDIIEHGVETAADGAIYALVRVHHWCGNDPVVFHLARVNLSSLLLLVADGVRFSNYGLNPAYVAEAKQPWHETVEELRIRSKAK